MIVQSLRERWPEHTIEAIVLSGGYGRGEGGVLRKNGQEYPFDDYDLLVVFRQIRSADLQAYNTSLHNAAQALSQRTAFKVDIAPACDIESLRKAPFNLFWYELRHGHKVIWGRPEVMENLPDFPDAELPASEAFKLLLNRGVELWRVIEAGIPLRETWLDIRWEPLLMALHNAVISIGDSLLILNQQYHWSYQERVQILKRYFQQGHGLPEASMLTFLYPEAIQYKLSPSDYRDLPVEWVVGKLEVVRKLFLNYFYFSLQHLGMPVQNVQTAYPEAVKAHLYHRPGLRQRWQNFQQNRTYFKSWDWASAWNWHPPHLRFLAALPYLLENGALEPGPELAGLFPGCGAQPDLDTLRQFFEREWKMIL